MPCLRLAYCGGVISKTAYNLLRAAITYNSADSNSRSDDNYCASLTYLQTSLEFGVYFRNTQSFGKRLRQDLEAVAPYLTGLPPIHLIIQ